MSIFEIKHQEQAIDIFQQAFMSERLSHAYILLGPRGIGKSSAAIEFAKILLCENPQSKENYLDSCSRCSSCKLVDAQTHPDFHLIYKELVSLIPGKKEHKAIELGIDVIRTELIEKVSLKPTMNKAKVFVVYEADRMTRASQNAILKTLEEPPAKTYIFLVTEQLGALLPTIRSRAQVLKFNLLPYKFVYDKLIENGAKACQAEFLSKFAPGQLGTALELLQLGAYDINRRIADELAHIKVADIEDFAQWMIKEAQSLASKMLEIRKEQFLANPSESELNRNALKLLLEMVGCFYRDTIRYKLGFEEGDLINSEQIELIKSYSEKCNIDELSDKIRMLSEAEKMINANVNQNLLMTDVFCKVIE